MRIHFHCVLDEVKGMNVKMSDEKKIEILAEILDLDAEELAPETSLADMTEWDSIAILSFIAMMDEEFGREVKGAEAKKIATVQDAMDLMKK